MRQEIAVKSGVNGVPSMKTRHQDDARMHALRDWAMSAVMQRGRFEPSGGAKLAILKEDGLMIGYRTPFNPLPKLRDRAKYEAANRGKNCRTDWYGIDVWLEDVGKVFSVGWGADRELRVHCCKAGPWQLTLERIAASSHKPDRDNVEPVGLSKVTGKAKATPKSARLSDGSPPGDNATTRNFDEGKSMRRIEMENRRLRRVISGLVLDRAILAKAAAGRL
jgi:hypothetical protein